MPPNKSPEPTAVGAGSFIRGSRRESAVAQLSTLDDLLDYDIKQSGAGMVCYSTGFGHRDWPYILFNSFVETWSCYVSCSRCF